MARVLVMACSVTKHPIPPGRLVPAWELYDGMGYRVAKKAERDGAFPPNVDVWILSAEYGLITRSLEIATYNRKMDRARATELAPFVTDELAYLIENEAPEEIYLWMGGDYLRAIRVSALLRDYPGLQLRTSAGQIGEQLSQLRTWLRGPEPAEQATLDLPLPPGPPPSAKARLAAHLARFRQALSTHTS